MADGAEYLVRKRKWTMKEVVWSVHTTCSALDRAGKGTSRDRKYIAHEDLTTPVNFELRKNNHCAAVGRLWQRVNCIPMGGSFPAQSADLHSVWGAYKKRNNFCRLGALKFSPKGVVDWEGRWVISLIQLRHNSFLGPRGCEQWRTPWHGKRGPCKHASTRHSHQHIHTEPVCSTLPLKVLSPPLAGPLALHWWLKARHTQRVALQGDWALHHEATLHHSTATRDTEVAFLQVH